MQTMSDHYLFKDLLAPTKALAKLPGVKPRLALRGFEAVFDHVFADDDHDEAWFGPGGSVAKPGEGVRIHESDWEVVWQEGGPYGDRRLTPEGAALLIQMYKNGVFDLHTDGPGDPSMLQAYADSGPELRRRCSAEREKVAAERERTRRMVQDPSQVTENDFSLSLLNRIFFEHQGPGEGEVEVGGIWVRKTLVSYSSNSGKSKDHFVQYAWRCPRTGDKRYLKKDSRFSENRRNDPRRNFGLPE